jgi:hypothetical protein
MYYKYGGGSWNTGEGDPGYMFDDDADWVRIAFPDDFDGDPDSGSMEFFAAVSDDDAFGGVYRFINVENAWGPTTETNTSTFGPNGDFDCVDLDVSGDVGDLSFFVGGENGEVEVSTNNGDRFGGTDKGPFGEGPAYVLMAPDFADSEEGWAGTAGTGAGFSLTRDSGDNFNQISLMAFERDAIVDYAMSNPTFVVYEDDGDYSLFKKDGSWERIYFTDSHDIDAVELSREFDSDDTLFIADFDAPEIWRNTDGGVGEFSGQASTPDDQLSAILALDNKTLVVGQDGGTQRTTNNGTTWFDQEGTGDGWVISFAVSPDFDSDEHLLAGDDNGEAFLSENAADRWEDPEGVNGGNTYVAFDCDYAENGFWYAASDDTILRFGDEDDISGNFDNISGLVVACDGAMYVSTEDDDGIWRALSGRPGPPPTWQQMDFDDDDTRPLYNLMLTSGSNVIHGTEWDDDIWEYTDILTGPVVLTSPGDGSSVDKLDRVTLTWQAKDGAKVYEVEVDTDPGFKGTRIYDAEHETTSVVVTGLDDGQTYYWRVRVVENDEEDMLSARSAKWSFTTRLGAGQWNPFVGGVPEAPANGATNVPLMPSFAWNAADGYDGYELIIDKDAEFKDVVVSKTGANALTTSVYLMETALENDTTYYWKVRAISKTSNSEWASGVFTTEGKAPPPPDDPPPPPPTPTPTTPIYIWVIIGIGAALIIAIIILIARTRRVA